MIKTLCVESLTEGTTQLCEIEKEVPYFVIGVEGDSLSDLHGLESLYGDGIVIDHFASVTNPKYLGSVDHLLQLAFITFKR